MRRVDEEWPEVLYDDEDYARLERVVRRQRRTIALLCWIDLFMFAAFDGAVLWGSR
jgi:hypothetical protein